MLCLVKHDNSSALTESTQQYKYKASTYSRTYQHTVWSTIDYPHATLE